MSPLSLKTRVQLRLLEQNILRGVYLRVPREEKEHLLNLIHDEKWNFSMASETEEMYLMMISKHEIQCDVREVFLPGNEAHRAHILGYPSFIHVGVGSVQYRVSLHTPTEEICLMSFPVSEVHLYIYKALMDMGMLALQMLRKDVTFPPFQLEIKLERN